jgi:hypothetical protein
VLFFQLVLYLCMRSYNLIKVTDRFVQHLEMLREPACTRCKPNVFGMGAYNDFRVSLPTSQYCHL